MSEGNDMVLVLWMLPLALFLRVAERVTGPK